MQKYGAGEPALILVPGLASGAWTWNGTVAKEAPSHATYVVTVGGFAGVAAARPETLAGIEDSLVTLIAAEHLDRPVLVGHSLGGTTVLEFGIDHPKLARAIVTVDGAPVFPSVAGRTADERLAAAKSYSASIAAQTPDAFLAGEKKTVADYVTDPTLADRVAVLAAKSDQAAVAAYLGDLISTDLRPQLGKLTLPTLLIAPVPAPPLPSYMPDAMATMDDATREKSTTDFYKYLFAGSPALQISTVDHARHFVMLDQPELFARALDDFLNTQK